MNLLPPSHFLFLQLEDGHSLFDYDVGLNDIIQLMVRPAPVDPAPPCRAVQNGGTGEKEEERNGTGGEEMLNGDSEDEVVESMEVVSWMQQAVVLCASTS